MSIQAGPFPYENITRYTTEAERAQIERIQLNDADVDRLVDLFRNGLRETAMFHSAAVQDKGEIFTEVTLRMSRPVQSADGTQVEESVSRATLDSKIGMTKIFKN